MPNKNVRDRALVRMLCHLDTKQQRGFNEYLSCSLFNTNPSLVVLYECLQSKALEGKSDVLSEAELLAGSGIKKVLLDKLCSLMMGHLRGFISLWHQRADPGAAYPAAFEAWKQMGLEPDLLEREYRKMVRNLQKLPNVEFGILDQLKLEHGYAQFKALQPRKEQQDLFKPTMALLDEFYAVTKLKYLCANISLGRVLRGAGEVGEFFLSQEELRNLSPLGQTYYQASLLLGDQESQPQDVEQLIQMLEEHGHSFSSSDHVDLYGHLLNISIRGLDSNEVVFEQLINRMYDSLLKYGLLMEGGKMAGSHFKNIVSTKLRIGALEEAETFMKSYSENLDQSERELILCFTKGQLAFFSLDFRRSIQLFRLVIAKAPSDLILGVEARKMLWKSFFELYDELDVEEYNEMIRLYDSFRSYIVRNTRLSEYHKESYENFIRVFNRLIRVGAQELWVSSVGQLQLLLEEAAGCERMSYRRWLLDAIQRRIQSQKRLG